MTVDGVFAGRRRFSETRAFAPPGRKVFPARLFHRPTQPFAYSAAHHPVFVLRRQPRNVFREHRDRLRVGTRQAGQIRSPKNPSWAVCVIDAAAEVPNPPSRSRELSEKPRINISSVFIYSELFNDQTKYYLINNKIIFHMIFSATN